MNRVIVWVALLGILLFSLILWAAKPLQQENIKIEGADVWSAELTPSEDLAVAPVSPRILGEYPDSSFSRNLIEPIELTEAAKPVQPRIIVEHPDSSFSQSLQKPEIEAMPTTTQPRVVVEYVDSSFSQTLQSPEGFESIAETLPPRIIVKHVDSALSLNLEPFSMVSVETVVKISPEHLEKDKGDTFTVNLNVEKVENLAGFQMSVNFDPNVLSVVKALEGDFLSKDEASTFWKEPVIDNEEGMITLTCSRTTPGGINGDGRLASITFKAKGSGESTLEMEDVALSNSEGNELSFKDIKGLVSIAQPGYDVNQNGVVDIFDLVIVGQHFGESPSKEPKADVNSDGKVDIFDLVMVGQHFGEKSEATSAAPVVASKEANVWLKARRSGSNLFVDLMTEGSYGQLYGFQFDLSFAPDSLSLLSVNKGELLGNRSYWKPPVIEDGSIEKAASTRLKVEKGAKGKGSLAKLNFRLRHSALYKGYLEIGNLKLVDPKGRLIKAVLKGDKVLLEEIIVPDKSALLQNYPNPFNPETWIPFQLANDADVLITIYDMSGSVIRTLDVGKRLAGIYASKDRAVYWNGRNNFGEKVASGVYFYSIQAGDFNATGKLVVSK